MRRTLWLMMLFPTVANAQLAEVTARAPAYRSGSLSLIGSASLGAGFVGASAAGTPFSAVALAGGIAVRFVARFGLTFEPRLGVDGLLTAGGAGLYALLAGRIGLGVGWALALTDVLALTPMLSYEAQYLGGGLASGFSGLIHAGAVELPLTVFLSRRAFVEVYARGGASLATGTVVPSVGAGYRFGVLW